MNSFYNRNGAFTLIEIMLAMAIVGVLAAGVLGMMSSHRAKAQQTKALAELSALVNPILMCKSDGGTINDPDGTEGAGTLGTWQICSTSANYGKWPSTVAGGPLESFGNYQAGRLGESDWWFVMNDGKVRVCCNGTYSRCGIYDHVDVGTLPWNDCRTKDLSNL